MNHNQKTIIIVGAAGALFFLTRKKAGAATGIRRPATAGGLLSNLLPTRGTNTPYIAGTNLATRNGMATAARVPSSGLGFPYGTGRTVSGAPTTVGGIAAGAGAALNGLFNLLARRPATGTPSTTAPRSTSGAGGGPSIGGGGSAGGGAAGSGGASRVPMGGSAGVAGQTYSNGYFDGNGGWHGYDGYYDESGQWVPTDANGNIVPSDTGIQAGGWDADGNWIPDDSSSTAIQGGYFNDEGQWVENNSATPIVAGAWDENGDWQSDGDPAVEFVGPIDQPGYAPNSDPMPLDAVDVGTGYVDPIGLDDGGMYFDDAQAATVDAGTDYGDYGGDSYLYGDSWGGGEANETSEQGGAGNWFDE